MISALPFFTACPSSTGIAATAPLTWLPMSIRRGVSMRPLATTVCTTAARITLITCTCGADSHGQLRPAMTMQLSSAPTAYHRPHLRADRPVRCDRATAPSAVARIGCSGKSFMTATLNVDAKKYSVGTGRALTGPSFRSPVDRSSGRQPGAGQTQRGSRHHAQTFQRNRLSALDAQAADIEFDAPQRLVDRA